MKNFGKKSWVAYFENIIEKSWKDLLDDCKKESLKGFWEKFLKQSLENSKFILAGTHGSTSKKNPRNNSRNSYNEILENLLVIYLKEFLVNS